MYIFSTAVESKLLRARIKMQQKYIDQFYMLYEDFNITKLPLLPQEVPSFSPFYHFHNAQKLLFFFSKIGMVNVA